MSENTNTEREASAILSKICDLFQIGKQARTESTILMNVETAIRLARLLHAVERDLFPQPELPEDDDPYATVDDGLPAPNSWRAKDAADYVAQFRAALAARESLSLPAAGQEPVAWRTFDGEGGYDYRTYEGNENYRAEWEKRNPNHKGWVEPLYAAPQPAVAAGWMPIETAPKDGTYLLLWEQYSTNPFVGCWAFGSWRVSHEHVDAEGGWDGAIVVDSIDQDRITHWMPLPPPPTLSAGSGKGE